MDKKEVQKVCELLLYVRGVVVGLRHRLGLSLETYVEMKRAEDVIYTLDSLMQFLGQKLSFDEIRTECAHKD